ncbi:MAG: DMT family transporter [bacterium]
MLNKLTTNGRLNIMHIDWYGWNFMEEKRINSLVYIAISAILFGASSPIAKILVSGSSPVALAGLLYIGAFAGLQFYSFIHSNLRAKQSLSLQGKDLLWLAGAVITGGILAPISLMMGLNFISGFTVSLLLNLEGTATALIAILLFKENAGRRLWISLGCMTIAGIFLTWDPAQGKFNLIGPVLVLFAMICWGFDNNLTRHIADKDPVQIAKIKGLSAGSISLLIAFMIGIKPMSFATISAMLAVGAFSYGISLVFFIKALKGLGAARTGAFFSIAPFLGAFISLVFLKEWIGWVMFPALFFMILGVWLLFNEKHTHQHHHKTLTHSHEHTHEDTHHAHEHEQRFTKPHMHEHTHAETYHAHVHWPDMHHRHEHD